MLTIELSEHVVTEILKLQAIEEGRMGNYTNVDQRLDKVRYRVNELLMASVLREIRKLQANPRLG